MMTLRTPFLGATLFISVAAAGLTPALAQTTPVPANSGAAQTDVRYHRMPKMLPGQLVDGRIAFLKAELKITPAQEAQWQPVAAAMRENASSLDRVITTARQDRGTMDAIQHIALRAQFAKVHADNDARLLTAFKPLFASLLPEQRQLANQLVAAHKGGHHRA
jgi:periplasmic protein CpxP/Spy